MKATRTIATALIAALSFAATPLPAADHIVPTTDVRQHLADQERSRAQKMEQLTEFFRSPDASRALAKAGMSAVEVGEAVSSLDNEALESLNARAISAQADLAAGALNNQQLTYIIIALGTAVLILVILAA